MQTTTTGSFGELFISSVRRVPWKGFVLGLFVPLVTMQLCDLLHKPILGAILAMVWCIVFFLADLFVKKEANAFALITLFMIATQFAAHVLTARLPQDAVLLSFVGIIDEGVFCLLLLISCGTKKPLILLLLGKEVPESIPEIIRRSRFLSARMARRDASLGVFVFHANRRATFSPLSRNAADRHDRIPLRLADRSAVSRHERHASEMVLAQTL